MCRTSLSNQWRPYSQLRRSGDNGFTRFYKTPSLILSWRVKTHEMWSLMPVSTSCPDPLWYVCFSLSVNNAKQWHVKRAPAFQMFSSFRLYSRLIKRRLGTGNVPKEQNYLQPYFISLITHRWGRLGSVKRNPLDLSRMWSLIPQT